jgi:hypothetical protein
MIYAQPGESFTAVLDAEGTTGLVGSITVQIENVDGTTHTAASTTGIVEVEQGIYSAVRTAPDTAATYIVVWNDAGSRAPEELIVTSNAAVVGGGGSTDGLSFLEMVNEVKARGFDEVGDDRIKQWINRAYARLCDRQVWPFLLASTSGAAPLTISDLRSVYAVRDSGQGANLEYADIRDLRVEDPGDDATGSASYWYQDDDAIAIYPASGATISVDYVKSPGDLTGDDDNALVPPRYRMLLIDMAVCEAYKDSDNLEAWQILRTDVEEQIDEMTNTLLVPNYDAPSSIAGDGSASTDW